MSNIQITTYVLATNADMRPEIVAVTVTCSQAEYETGEHYEKAGAAVDAQAGGWEALGCFDANDPAGMAINPAKITTRLEC